VKIGRKTYPDPVPGKHGGEWWHRDALLAYLEALNAPPAPARKKARTRKPKEDDHASNP
jgi:hypothetical protein